MFKTTFTSKGERLGPAEVKSGGSTVDTSLAETAILPEERKLAEWAAVSSAEIKCLVRGLSHVSPDDINAYIAKKLGSKQVTLFEQPSDHGVSVVVARETVTNTPSMFLQQYKGCSIETPRHIPEAKFGLPDGIIGLTLSNGLSLYNITADNFAVHPDNLDSSIDYGVMFEIEAGKQWQAKENGIFTEYILNYKARNLVPYTSPPSLQHNFIKTPHLDELVVKGLVTFQETAYPINIKVDPNTGVINSVDTPHKIAIQHNPCCWEIKFTDPRADRLNTEIRFKFTPYGSLTTDATLVVFNFEDGRPTSCTVDLNSTSLPSRFLDQHSLTSLIDKGTNKVAPPDESFNVLLRGCLGQNADAGKELDLPATLKSLIKFAADKESQFLPSRHLLWR